jgi:hypothetical protein
VSAGDLFRELVEYLTAASRDQASEEFAAACRRVDQDPRERQRLADIAHLIDTEDAIYTQALSALGRSEHDTALPLLQRAAEAGIGEAAWLLAGQLEEQGQTQESLTWYRRAAADGDLRAARRILGPANFSGCQPASTVPGNAGHPARPRARGLLGSWWVTGIILPATAAAAAVAAVVAAVAIAAVFPPRGTSPGQAGSRISISQPLSNGGEVRAQAITWILQQVNRSAVVGCDAQICSDLAGRGFPSGNLLTLGPQSNNPLGATLVVATAAIRAQYGARLASLYAPAVIATFGSGSARIDIRLVYPGGTMQYRAVEPKAARARKIADTQLLTNSQLTFSATATSQLRSGNIDPRLPLLLATIALRHPVRIVDFGDQSPGGGPASLLRSVDLATPDPAAHLTRGAFIRWIQQLTKAQRAQYRATVSQVKLPTGQTVVRIHYAAPSPLR